MALNKMQNKVEIKAFPKDGLTFLNIQDFSFTFFFFSPEQPVFWSKSFSYIKSCQDNSCLMNPNTAVVVHSHVLKKAFIFAL